MSKVTDTWPHPLAKKAAEGCCGNDTTRGHLCNYHNGYAAGVEDVAALFTEAINAALTVLNGGEVA